MTSHDTLGNYYYMNFLLNYEHHYDLEYLDNMQPWEREVYIGMLTQHLKKKRAKNA